MSAPIEVENERLRAENTLLRTWITKADLLVEATAEVDRLRALLNDRMTPASDVEMQRFLEQAQKHMRSAAWRRVAYVVKKWAVERERAVAAERRFTEQERHNVASRRSLCELSDRYKAERDAALASQVSS